MPGALRRRVHSGESGAVDGQDAIDRERGLVRSRIFPEARSGRWGEGLTADKMKECVWVRPELVAEIEFVEWTPEGHLRHARFAGLKVGMEAREVGLPAVLGPEIGEGAGCGRRHVRRVRRVDGTARWFC